MKKTKATPVIVESAGRKFLVRDFRPPIQLRTSPRKKKNKLKKEIKRLDEQKFSSLKNKKQQKRKKNKFEKIKKQLQFDQDEQTKEENSILLIISNDEQENQLNDEELTSNKCR